MSKQSADEALREAIKKAYLARFAKQALFRNKR